MTIFLLTLLVLGTILDAWIIHRKEMGSNVTIMQPVPPERLHLFDEHGFEAAVKEERRQMAFDEFCLNYNKELDYFCSKPAGHENSGFIRSDDEHTKPRHGYAGIFWEARNG